MTNPFSSALVAYRRYRAVKAGSKAYKALRYSLLSAAAAYVLLLVFPQVLFAHGVSHNNLTVYSRVPLPRDIHAVLDRAEARLAASGINDTEIRPRVFISDGHGLYALLSLQVGANSFAKGYPLFPTDNVFVNKSDVAKDLVFRHSRADAERGLSGVIAHEVTHLLIRKKLGYVGNLRLPQWKKEGYCEYVAGGSLLGREEGARRWKANPKDDSGYRYFKYYMLVKHLIDVKKLSAEDVFAQDVDVRALEVEVLGSL